MTNGKNYKAILTTAAVIAAGSLFALFNPASQDNKEETPNNRLRPAQRSTTHTKSNTSPPFNKHASSRYTKLPNYNGPIQVEFETKTWDTFINALKHRETAQTPSHIIVEATDSNGTKEQRPVHIEKDTILPLQKILQNHDEHYIKRRIQQALAVYIQYQGQETRSGIRNLLLGQSLAFHKHVKELSPPEQSQFFSEIGDLKQRNIFLGYTYTIKDRNNIIKDSYMITDNVLSINGQKQPLDETLIFHKTMSGNQELDETLAYYITARMPEKSLYKLLRKWAENPARQLSNENSFLVTRGIKEWLIKRPRNDQTNTPTIADLNTVIKIADKITGHLPRTTKTTPQTPAHLNTAEEYQDYLEDLLFEIEQYQHKNQYAKPAPKSTTNALTPLLPP